MTNKANFSKNQKVIMTLPNGYKKEYWFSHIIETEDGRTIAVCMTASNGKYHTNVALNLLSAA